jgi:Carboxypeptidase regulatory-like domain
MTKNQEVKLNMYNSVLSHCMQNTAITAAAPALQTAIAALKTTTTAIQMAVQQQLQTTKGFTASKSANKEALVSFATQVAGAVFAWATDKKDMVVQEKTKTTMSSLARLRDEELAPACREYYEMGKANETQLGDYGISNAVLDEFLTTINNYTNAVPGPRNAQALRSAYKKLLVDLFKTADDILKNKIDKLSLPLQKNNKPFMDAYKSNRVIIDAGGTATQLRMNITNADGLPLKGASVAIESLGYNAQAGSKGALIIKPLLQGTYKIVISQAGYTTVTLDEVKVLRGQINTQEITLKAVA